MLARVRAFPLLLIATCIFRAALTAPTEPKASRTIFPSFGVQAGSPQKLSAPISIAIGHGGINPYVMRSFGLLAEPGLGGVKMGLGYGQWSQAGPARIIAVSALRTWNHPWNAAGNTTYLGLEGRQFLPIPPPGWSVNAGVFKSIHNSSREWIVSGGIGFSWTY